MKFGFVYLWKDTKNNKFYLGSHQGGLDDGYVGSGSPHFKNAYAKRPETFRRRILETLNFEVHKELRIREEYWLSMVKTEELGNKYYNLKRYAAGGDIISELSKEKREQHREKSRLAWKKGEEALNLWRKENPERTIEIAKHARSCVKKPTGPMQGSMMGELNPFYSKTHNAESRNKMSLALKGRESNRKNAILSVETKAKISANNAQSKEISTPHGNFPSCVSYANFLNNIVSDRTLVGLIKDCDKPIGSTRQRMNILLKIEDIGKTPRQ